MNLNTLFTVNTGVAGLFGLGFVFAPEAMLAPYGVSSATIAASVMMSRFFGASNLGYAVLFFFMRSTPDSDVKIAVTKAMSIGFGIACLVSISVQMSGEIGPLGWSTVALYGIFAAAYGYFGFGGGNRA
tara:strand:+ start:36 stop:422 length:387 start_codon:yes stop_codon:yes gene_type:complete